MSNRCSLSLCVSQSSILFPTELASYMLTRVLDNLALLQITAISFLYFELLARYLCILIKMNPNIKNATILQHKIVDKSIINNYETSPIVMYTLLAGVIVIACCCFILVLLRLRKMCYARCDNFDVASTTGNLSFSKYFVIYFFMYSEQLSLFCLFFFCVYFFCFYLRL